MKMIFIFIFCAFFGCHKSKMMIQTSEMHQISLEGAEQTDAATPSPPETVVDFRYRTRRIDGQNYDLSNCYPSSSRSAFHSEPIEPGQDEFEIALGINDQNLIIIGGLLDVDRPDFTPVGSFYLKIEQDEDETSLKPTRHELHNGMPRIIQDDPFTFIIPATSPYERFQIVQRYFRGDQSFPNQLFWRCRIRAPHGAPLVFYNIRLDLFRRNQPDTQGQWLTIFSGESSNTCDTSLLRLSIVDHNDRMIPVRRRFFPTSRDSREGQCLFIINNNLQEGIFDI